MLFKLLMIIFLAARGNSYLTPFERSASPYDLGVRGPRKFAICGESGGIESFQLAQRVLCASIAERERNVVSIVVNNIIL